MYKKSKLVTYGDWRGINNVQDPMLISDHELQDCVNFFVSPSGRLVARNGLTQVCSIPARALAITKYDGDIYIACNDGNIYKWDGISLTSIGTHSGTEVYMLVAFQKLWIADGSDLKYWDGTTFGSVNDLLYHTEKIADGDGSTSSFNYTVLHIPVAPNSVTITYTLSGTEYTATDDGEGNISGINVSGTINYTTGEVSISFVTPPDSGTPINITYSCSSVLDVQADFIEFRQDRLWAAKGDSLYYSNVRNPAVWDFIKVASQDESDISAIDQLYDRLIIFKEGKDRGIYALSGNSNTDFVVSLIAKGVSTTNKSKASVLGDLYFLDGGQMYSLRTIVEYGDIKPIQINQNYAISSTRDYQFLVLPVYNVIFAVDGTTGFAFTPNKKAFTSLAFGKDIAIGVVIENDVYLADDSYLYKMDDVNLDDDTVIVYQIKTKILNLFGYSRLLIKRFAIYGFGIDEANITVSVFKRDQGYNYASFTFPKIARWDESTWDVDKWSDPSAFIVPSRQILSGRFVYFVLFSNERFVLDAITMEVA